MDIEGLSLYADSTRTRMQEQKLRDSAQSVKKEEA